MGQPRIRIEGLSVAYQQGQPILHNINLDIAKGEIISLIGASGCGKSTLLNVIAGLLAAHSGRVLLDGKPIDGPAADRVMVFQDDAVFPWMRVRANVEYGLRIKGLGAAEMARRVDEVLDLVELKAWQNAYPKELSGGMRKRVDLARAIAVDPQVLLMDEPFGALDAMTKERLQVEYLNICERIGITSVFVTHDLEEAIFLGDRVVVLGRNPGHIASVLDVEFAHPRDIAIKRTAAFQFQRGRLNSLIR
ncbi:MAG TPA: ABC transporter ATP-binding protein [Ramlibacter sp.]|uniref:ABC transporter ATP-binding protein n=1 Tax=Ramlibacter sp. TaxID=1917967 RepID=UPI002B522B70|nr:ABC transporter ATP-binding protein [Ramlibacter sp.]HVZ44879.1 ABC transporter ATP-binding protein [Ramlibacter sp.]